MDKKHVFGQRIRAIRKAKGLSQRELAERLGRTTEAVSQLERGLYLPSYETLEGLAEALAIPVGDLFGAEDAPLSAKAVRLRAELNELGRQLNEDMLELAVGQVRLLAGKGSS